MTIAVAEPELIVRREGAAGVIRLNRPKAINALTLEMARGIDKALAAVVDVGDHVERILAARPRRDGLAAEPC